MSDNEYAAIKIMGYRPSWFSGFWLTIHDDGFDELVAKSSWHPDTDRNQLWALIEKAQDVCPKAVNHAVMSFHADYEMSQTEFWRTCMECPSQALATIVKAHKEASK